jgi:hypothetical protein
MRPQKVKFLQHITPAEPKLETPLRHDDVDGRDKPGHDVESERPGIAPMTENQRAKNEQIDVVLTQRDPRFFDGLRRRMEASGLLYP